MNKALLPQIEEHQNFVDAAPSLFGASFAQKSKELVDQIKMMRFYLPGHKGSKYQSIPQQQREGVPVQLEAKEGRKSVTKDTNIPRKVRDPSGTNKLINTTQNI